MTKIYDSFESFCENIEIRTPQGFIPLNLHDYQKRLSNFYEKEDFVIVKKFRQGGFTTISSLYLLYKCLKDSNNNSAIICRTNRESENIRKIISSALKNLEISTKENTSHAICFNNDSRLYFLTPHSYRGFIFDYVLLDEVAFWNDIELFWDGIQTGLKKAFIVSTPNGKNNWFYKVCQDALREKNKFKVFECSFKDNPAFDNKEWIESMYKFLGEKGWRQEVLATFEDV